MPLKHGLIYHNITQGTVITVAERASDIRITTVTTYLALTGELWGVYCENIWENRLRYNRTTVYLLECQ